MDAALLGNGDLALVAPTAGTVIEVNIQPGASVSGSGGAAIVVADLGSMFVKAELDPAGTRAAAGMSVRLDIITEGVTGVLVIPNEAVRMADGKQVVDVLDDAGNVRTVTVTLGMTDGRTVEVTDGLEAGQQVVLPGAGE